MLLVSDVYDEVSRVMGQCDDAATLSCISDATEILCNKTDIDPLIGWVDINTAGGRAITLPREVDTVLALNISGVPSFPRDRWAEFHLNGKGTDCGPSCTKYWDDKGDHPIFADPTEPVQLTGVAVADDAEAEVWAYGYDANDKRIFSTDEDDNTVDGYKVVLSESPAAPDPTAPFFKRITEIRKSVTKGFVSLYGNNEDSETTLLGQYEPFETLPKYRRLLISSEACWVRIQFRRKVFRVTTQTDRIPLHSRYALLLMCKALQKFDDDKIDEAKIYEEKAVALLLEKQLASNPPVSPSMQVSPHSTLVDRHDRLT